MTFRRILERLSLASVLPLAFTFSSAIPAQAQDAAKAPEYLSRAQSVTPANTSTQMTATVWLNLHNRQALDAATAKIYQEGSPSYHHWLKWSDLAQYRPTATEVATVKKELTSKGLTVLSTDKSNMYIRVSGSVAALQSAFNTQINHYTISGKQITAAAREPRASGAAATLVAAIDLGAAKAEPHIARPINPETGKAFPASPVPSQNVATPDGAFFASYCFRAPEHHLFKTAGASLPVGSYYGNRYGADITSTTAGNLAPCGYSAVELESAYNLNAAYGQGLNGKGQTIVIVDAFGSPTIQADANTFNNLMHLPKLDSSNFAVVYPQGMPATQNAGWAEETSLDVEWAHAAAPGANIVLLIAPTNSFADLETTVFFALANQIGNVISNSYGAPESLLPASILQTQNSEAQLAASLGISINFSTGDNGDFVAAFGLSAPTVGAPADSPYATAVGGTSVALYGHGNNHFKFQTGWGNNITRLYHAASSSVDDPPFNEGFIFGAGGGESGFFAKPSWQKSLPGTGRQLPDVSAVADPYTGVEIVITSGGSQGVLVIGGTSLACPWFSGIWAIANQKAGHALGQASPIIAKLPSSALIDITDVSSATDVAGTITDSTGSHFYSAAALAAPLENTHNFYSALYNGLSGSWYDLTFGTDTSLTTHAGWDNVTGYGSPNGLNFILSAAKY